jgi:hypothetical protein
MLFMGKTRAEAIDWVQETLGPVTPRNIAEDTFTGLIAEGVVAFDEVGLILTEDMDEEELRMRARNSIIRGANQQAGRRRAGGPTKHNRAHHRHNRVTDSTPYTPPNFADDEECDDEE